MRLLTHVGEYQGEVVASNILGEARAAHYEAIPDVVYTDPQAAAVGAADAEFSATARLSGAYALGPEAGEWMQQATPAIRARVPLAVLRDVIQPFPAFSEIHGDALKALRAQIAAAR